MIEVHIAKIAPKTAQHVFTKEDFEKYNASLHIEYGKLTQETLNQLLLLATAERVRKLEIHIYTPAFSMLDRALINLVDRVDGTPLWARD